MKDLNVLIVEDEHNVAFDVANYIEDLGYHVVDICDNSEKALSVATSKHVDILIMDICLKGQKDGLDTAAHIKAQYPRTEVIFLCDHLDAYNVDKAMSMNPVAYLSKPINREEQRIVLKIAMHRLSKAEEESSIDPVHLKLDDEFCYDTKNAVLFCCHEPIHLTKKESALLELLLRHKHTIVDINTIENTIWPDKECNPNTVRSLMKRLRQKLKHKFIETFSTQGYKISLHT